MAEAPCFYPVLLISFLAGLASGSEADAKSVCAGDSVILFNSTQINSSDTTMSLYRNGDKIRVIASWEVDGSKISHENTNIFRDEHNTIWLINVHQTDEGNYILLYNAGSTLSKREVKLSVLVAPFSTCKLKTLRSGMVLKAYLEDEECGKPRASVYWLQYPDVQYEDDDLILLQAGREAGTYYACIRGPAVRCTNRVFPSLDHCTAITVKESSILSGNGGTESKTDALLTMVALILLFQILSVYFLHRKCKLVPRKLCSCVFRGHGRRTENVELNRTVLLEDYSTRDLIPTSHLKQIYE